MGWFSWLRGNTEEGPGGNGFKEPDEVSLTQRRVLSELRDGRRSLDETLAQIQLIRDEADDILGHEDDGVKEDGEHNR